MGVVDTFSTVATTSSSSLALTVPRAVAAGSSIVLVAERADASGNPVGLASITDSRSNTWHLNDAGSMRAGNEEVVISRAHLTTGLQAGDTITVTWNATNTRHLIVAHVVPDMQDAAAEATSGTTLTSNTSTGLNGLSGTPSGSTGGSTTTPQCVVIAGFAVSNTAALPLTPGSGYTAGGSVTTASGSNDRGLATEYKTTSTAGVQTAGATLGTSSAWAEAIAAYPLATAYTAAASDSSLSSDSGTAQQSAARDGTDTAISSDAGEATQSAARAGADVNLSSDFGVATLGVARTAAGVDVNLSSDFGAVQGAQARTGVQVDTSASSDAGSARMHRVPVGPELVDWYVSGDGRVVKRMRGQEPTSTVPGAPTSVRVVRSTNGTAADVFYGQPADDGGSPVTGFLVTEVGGPTQTPPATVLSAHFTGLSRTTTYRFGVQAVNDIGPGPTVFVISSTARFPGDPLPGKMLGLDEGDDDPTHVSAVDGEMVAPETLAGVPIGAMRAYFSVHTADGDASSILATSGGTANNNILKRIQAHAAKGRMTFGSIHFDNVAAAGNGINNTGHYNLIAYIEENLDVPFHYTCQHEVDDPAPASGLETNWGRLMKTVAWQRDKYADANGGVGTYRFKNFALGFILTGSGYARGDQAGAVGPLWQAATYTTNVTVSAATDVFTAPSAHMLTNGCRVRLLAAGGGLSAGTDYFVISATSTTLKLSASRGGAAVNVTADAANITLIYHNLFDFAAVDAYQQPLSPTSPIGRTGQPVWGPSGNLAHTVTWVSDPAHQYPLAITETGVHYNDADAGTQLSIFLEKVLTSANPVFAVYYFNSNGSGTRQPAQWALMNVRDDRGLNDNLATVFARYMADSRFVHFYDLGYPRPPGV